MPTRAVTARSRAILVPIGYRVRRFGNGSRVVPAGRGESDGPDGPHVQEERHAPPAVRARRAARRPRLADPLDEETCALEGGGVRLERAVLAREDHAQPVALAPVLGAAGGARPGAGPQRRGAP